MDWRTLDKQGRRSQAADLITYDQLMRSTVPDMKVTAALHVCTFEIINDMMHNSTNDLLC